MKRIFVALMMMLALVTAQGCGGGDDGVTVTEVEIFSDRTVDADIRQDASGVRTVTKAIDYPVPSVGVGLDFDPSTLPREQYRAFLYFPLDLVPLNARIESATLSIVINEVAVVSPTATIPISVDLVSSLLFPPPVVASDFDVSFLARQTVPRPISLGDVSDVNVIRYVDIDVTALMREAQFQGVDLQLRILQDSGAPGFFEIDDTSDPDTRPLLTVRYFF